MMELLKTEPTPFTWANYCAMPVVDQAVWEDRGDGFTKAMVLLLNSKKNNAKIDLRLAYS